MIRRPLLRVFSHRTLALMRWDLQVARTRLANGLTGSNGTLKRHVASMPRPRYLNLGSGPRGASSPHWLNVDCVRDVNVHYLVDLSRPLPLQDGSIDGIFSEHVVEHFTQEDGLRLLSECVRVLAPGGVARFITPDAAKVMQAYFTDPDGLVARRTPESGLPMEAVNSWFRQRYEHQFLYDWKLARHMFLAAGFTRVEQASFGESQCVPRDVILDDEKYAWESLYIDAVT